MDWGVSYCCGCSYEESTITDCCQVEYIKKYIEDLDSIEPFCDSCNEVAESTGYICNECGNWFEEPEEKNEYDARTYENYLEDRADARRKYGE